MKRFQLSRRATKDLELIADYIFTDNPDAAESVLDDFNRAFLDLARMPFMGHTRRDLTARNVRFWPVRSYLVVYQTTKPLRIVRVIHGKRDVASILR